MFYMPFYFPLFPFFPFYPYPGVIGPFPEDDSLRRKRFWWWYLNRPMMSASSDSGTDTGTDTGTATASAEPAAYIGHEADATPVTTRSANRRK